MYSIPQNHPKKPRIRVFSIVRKMNQQQQHQNAMNGGGGHNQMIRVPKQELGVAPPGRRYVQQQPGSRAPQSTSSHHHSQQQQQQQPHQNQNQKNGKTMSSVTIEEVPNHEFLDSLNNSAIHGGGNGQKHFDEEKLPVFLVKLWNIIEDPNLQSIVHWDESGASFHIDDPFSFCKNVLPHFFKHNNLNSLIRQLNMYGFRKMTPLSQGGLTRTESDQDHLEFSHPCFVQHRPDLMQQIKRKQSARTVEDKQVNEQTQQNLEVVMQEMRSMREKARNMEAKMNSLTKENREIWDQMHTMRQQHARQQQYFKKLLHFLVSVMQPGLSKRVAKRGVLEIDFGGANAPGSSSSKRGRNAEDGPYKDVCDLLEVLQRESQDTNFRRFSNQDCGPLISEVTDEFGNSPGGRSSDAFSDAFARFTENAGSREQSPHPIISQPSSSSNLAAQGGREDIQQFGGGSSSSFKEPSEPHYMGSGALTTENVHRGVPTKRNYQGGMAGKQPTNQQFGQSVPPPVVPQKRATFNKPTTRQSQQTLPSQFYNPNQFQSSSQNTLNNQLMRLEDNHIEDPHQDLYSPTLSISPSFDRQISQELQDYYTGYGNSVDNFRDLLSSSNWETFGDIIPEDEDDEHAHSSHPHQAQLALKNAPENSFYGADSDVGDLLDPILSDTHNPENGFEVADGNYIPLADEEIFPHSPVLRTPSPSDLA